MSAPYHTATNRTHRASCGVPDSLRRHMDGFTSDGWIVLGMICAVFFAYVVYLIAKGDDE